MTTAPAQSTFLSTPRGVLTLALLCGVQFMDVIDSSIMNVALPSIRAELGFSQQQLQWVLSGYLVTYGGFLLLGGRLGDLLGRRRVLIAGTMLFAVCSLAGGLAPTAAALVGARVVQGIGAALMAPAGLSLLTTSFTENRDRTRALGVWGAMSGVAAATGVFLGGVLSQGPGWRFVLLVNLPVCVLIVAVAARLLPDDRGAARIAGQDVGAAALLAAAMLTLIYTLVQAPALGWGDRSTVAGLLGSAALLGAFVVLQARSSSPLFPYSLFRVRGLLAANITQLLAFAGFLSVFFFLTLYMQNVQGYSPTESGSAYLPVTAGIILAAGAAAQLIPRVGTRPVTVVGALVAAVGVLLLSRIPVHGHYPGNLLPGLLVMSIGLGAVFVAVTTAANAGVPADKAGLAAGLLNASLQLGSALGLAVFSAIATATTRRLLSSDVGVPQALTTGFAHALLACALVLLAAAVIAARAANTRGSARPHAEAADDAALRAPAR